MFSRCFLACLVLFCLPLVAVSQCVDGNCPDPGNSSGEIGVFHPVATQGGRIGIFQKFRARRSEKKRGVSSSSGGLLSRMRARRSDRRRVRGSGGFQLLRSAPSGNSPVGDSLDSVDWSPNPFENGFDF